MTIHFANRLHAELKSSASFTWSSGIGALLALPLLASAALANPLSASVTTGSASIASSSTKTQIDQKSEDVVIDWSSFNIGAGQTTQFVQPNAQAIAVNRIGGNSASQILGTLDANGRIVLINGNGMLFGKGAAVNVGSLVATSNGGSDVNALSGRFAKAGKANAAVVNDGTITANKGGLVALVAPNVTNAGTVNAKLGTVSLGGATSFTVDFAGDGLVSFAARSASPGTVTNSGKLDGATVTMTARSAEGLAAGVVNMGGVIEAHAANGKGGDIILDAGNRGAIDVTGTLDASGTHGGTILVGGDIHGGADPSQDFSTTKIEDAAKTTIVKGAKIEANGILGAGGNIVVWSNGRTTFDGAVSAKGGANSQGGFAEVSAHKLLAFKGAADLSDAGGSFGTLLLDPENVTIQATGPNTVTTTFDTYTGNVPNSVLMVTTLEHSLKDANITVQTGSSGSQAGDITIASALTWSAHTLTLDAYHSIDIDADVSVTGTAGLALNTNHGGTGGSLTTDGGEVTFASLTEGLAINGTAYTLVDNVAGLAAAIAADPGGDFALAQSYNAQPDGTYAASPVATSFSGKFEGLGNAISNLTIDETEGTSAGLFALVNAGATIENLSVLDATVTGPAGADAGALAAVMNGNASNVTSSGTVTGGPAVGGLFGTVSADSTIANSSSLADVTCPDADSACGGLAGLNAGTISSSFSSGTVNAGYPGKSEEGGLVGWNQSGANISESYATGAVEHVGSKGAVEYVDDGGLVGENAGSIAGSYATGEAWAGLVYENSGSIDNSYATVSYNTSYNDSATVGLVYFNQANGVVDNSYATGVTRLAGLVYDNAKGATIENSHATGNVASSGADDAGGLAATNEGLISNSYATGNLAGGFDVGGLVSQNTGTIENSYATGTVQGTEFVGGLIGKDTGAVENSFATGAVSCNGAQVKCGDGQALGGLIGVDADGSISTSYATGSVTGPNKADVGGLIGRATSEVKISNVYATGAVTGGTSSNDGGLIGYADLVSKSLIEFTYATGSVTGGSTSSLGGLVGYLEGMDELKSNYWDTQTSGIPSAFGVGNDENAAGVTGLTTAQLQSGLPSGFSSAIWGENGSINGGLPYLLAIPPA